jgi:microsomal dipeptidase-like Zn-dependent dipeptidase
LTHEHPTYALAFGGNYAFAGRPDNAHDGLMDDGYTAACGGCRPGRVCDHGEVQSKLMAALGVLGGDMGLHASHMGPVHDSHSHLRYSTAWIREAHAPPPGAPQQTRLEIMVAFAVENEALCEQLRAGNAANGPGYACSHGDSLASLERQLAALKRWAAANTAWLEIAYSAGDLRRIVAAGKLAVILGVESDYAFGAEDRRFDPVARLEHYHALGVRSFYLAHKVNSRLAGADVYRSRREPGGKLIRTLQALAGCFYVDDAVAEYPLRDRAGHRFCANACGAGQFRGNLATDACVGRYGELSEFNYARLFFGHGDDWFNGFAAYPELPGFAGASGTRMVDGIERNNLGLSIDGERVVRAAMRRGMIVNIDHVSSRARLDMARISQEFDGYPLNALHNNPNALLRASDRGRPRTPGPSETDLDEAELALVRDSGGFFGVRLGPVDAREYPASGVTAHCPRTATETAKILAYLLDRGLAVGYSLDYAAVTQAVHSRSFARCGRGLGRDRLHRYRTHVTEGLSHIGMMPYWHAELAAVGLESRYLDKLQHDGPEAFMRMWERCEAKADAGPRTNP